MGFPKFIIKLISMKSISSAAKFIEDHHHHHHHRQRQIDWHSSYDSWLKKHPSALDRFDKMMEMAKGKKIVVFLDYDGTLSPIVDDPDVAFMADEMRSVVQEVGRCFPTSIISGRSRQKVYEFVRLDNINYAGSHGMDIMALSPPLPGRGLPNKYPHPTAAAAAASTRAAATENRKVGDPHVIYQPAQHFLPEIKEIHRSLTERTSAIEGVKIEDNNFCLSVHYRNVMKQDLISILEEEVRSVLEEHPHFRLTSGKMVLEIRPPIHWDKGHAVEYLLDSLDFTISDQVLPIYIGDDRTDEDAFKVVERMRHGYSIIVTSVPRDTRATYSLHDTAQVMSFLERLARWKKDAVDKKPILASETAAVGECFFILFINRGSVVLLLIIRFILLHFHAC